MKLNRICAVPWAVALGALCGAEAARGQAEPTTRVSANEEPVATVVISGQRRTIRSAQRLKLQSDEVMDAVEADAITKLPDRSLSEVLQRVPGVSIDRTMSHIKSLNDGIEKFAVEGAGVTVRGSGLLRSETNGRESFSANGGRAISFEDVPPELLAGVDVYKNPAAAQIEGGIGGLINLRTWQPFDFPGFKGAMSLGVETSSLRRQEAPSGSVLLSNRWQTDLGEFGALIDLSHATTRHRTDAFQVEPYFPRTDALSGDTSGQTRWVPSGVSWRSGTYDRQRDGLYGAVQWRLANLRSSLNLFETRHHSQWRENASFFYGDRWATTVDAGADFNTRHVFQSGMLRGVVLGTDSRYADTQSRTRDLSWNLGWDVSDRLTLSTDLQWIRAHSQGTDNTIGLKTAPLPGQRVDLAATRPRFDVDAADRAYLADPAHYFWNFTQDHRESSSADMKALRLDAAYRADAPSLLRVLRLGVRLTDRQAVTRQTEGGYHWAPITESWLAPGGQLAWLDDPRFGQNHELHAFDGFFNGAGSPPAPVLVPRAALLQQLPGSFEALHRFRDQLCRDAYAQPGDRQACIDSYSWVSPTGAFGTPRWTNPQTETTQAAYLQAHFGFEDGWAWPLDGHLGIRLVRTSVGAVGRVVFSPRHIPGVPDFEPLGQSDVQFRRTYTRALPSLNLRYRVDDHLQLRAAVSRGMTRPDFYQLQGYIALSQNIPDNYPNTSEPITYTGDGSRSNPFLQPTMSTNVDLSAEYEFARTGLLSLTVFNKQLSDLVVGRTSIYRLKDTQGTPHDFVVASPVNGASGYARGLELGFQRHLDGLPGWLAGFGLQANYTFIASRQRLYSPLQPLYCTGLDPMSADNSLLINGCDTDGRTFGDLPMQNVSRHAYNLAMLYDLGPWSVRLAYNWRGRYLQAASAYGTNGGGGLDTNPDSPRQGEHHVSWALPTWAGAYGQWDLGVVYNISNRLSLSLQAQNLTDATYTQLMQQHIGMMQRAAWSSGRRYAMRINVAL